MAPFAKKSVPGGKGQKNLFSFFSKKSSPKVPKSIPSAKVLSSLTSTMTPTSSPGSDASTTGGKKFVGASAAASVRKGSTAASAKARKLLERVTIGTKLAVFWPDDSEYYPCVVHSRPAGRVALTYGSDDESSDGSHVYNLVYDDGEEEIVDLATEKFRILGGKMVKKRSSDVGDEDGDASTPSPGGAFDEKNPKRRRIIEEESDAEMDEEDVSLSDEDGGGDGDDDSGSEYKGGGKDDEDLDEEEEFEVGEQEEKEGPYDDEGEEDCEGASPRKKAKTEAKMKKAAGKKPKPLSYDKPMVTIITSPSNSTDFSSSAVSRAVTQSIATKGAASNEAKARLTSDQDVSWMDKIGKSPSRVNKAGGAGAVTKGVRRDIRTKENASSTPSTAAVGPPQPVPGAVNPAGSHYHNHLSFFWPPSNRRDARDRPSSHSEYDSRTLSVDKKELMRKSDSGKISPAQVQWWETKAQYADAVLLFKTGKFYEMYHDDADIGVKYGGMTYMKGTIAHSGFPEAGYARAMKKIVDAGYKVARVEQTETPDALKERKKSMSRNVIKPQVVCREVCAVVTRGTRTFCYLEDDRCLEESGGGGGGNSAAGPLIAIREILLDGNGDGEGESDGDDSSVRAVCEYGIAVVDAVRGVVTLGQFADDALRSRLITLLANFSPSEILCEGGPGGASPILLSVLRSACGASHGGSVHLDKINPKEQFPKSTAVDPADRRRIDRPGAEVRPWDVAETVAELHRKGYYPRSTRKKMDGGDIAEGTARWPEVLRACAEGGAALALSSFGAALFYLQRSLIDEEILSLGIVKAYVPPKSCNKPSAADASEIRRLSDREARRDEGVELVEDGNGEQDHPSRPPPRRASGANDCKDEAALDSIAAGESLVDHLALDGATLSNLEILRDIASGSYQGSLLSKIDVTRSPHGSRLLRAWLLRPLFRKADIDRRADVVEELSGGSAAMAMSDARTLLKKTGDVERLVSRVHSMGGGGGERSEYAADASVTGKHPDERAVLYEMEKHTKRKVSHFSKLLHGLRAAADIPDAFENVDIRSPLLKKIVRTTDDGGCFPVGMKERLDWFVDNFDLEQAAKGEYEPTRGTNSEYDNACDAIDDIKRSLEEYKGKMCSILKPGHTARSWKYINTKEGSKDKYLIELPVSVRVPDDYVIKAKRGKGANQVNKYRTGDVANLVDQLELAIDVKKAGKAAGMKIVFKKFADMRSIWMAAAHATAMLDALGALAEIAVRPGFCRPQIVDCPPTEKPGIRILQGRHPCVDITHNGEEFIPNDLILGGNLNVTHDKPNNESSVLLLSGPNMGGKSTLLRQTCLITILAQLGSYVPAEECALTPVDRIFTRLGASDRILLGQSTFFVELAETAAAVRGATRRSLVIMDELGRGTSTFDGTAIASSTVQYLVKRNRCLTLFATHYHSLLEDWKDEPTVRLGHMECIVEDDNVDVDGNAESSNNITFLYTLGEGKLPKSFGVNVARLAGLPSDVLKKAKTVSAAFEAEMNGETQRKILPSNAKNLFGNVKITKNISATSTVDVTRLWKMLQ